MTHITATAQARWNALLDAVGSDDLNVIASGDNADLAAREEGHDRYSERWYQDALTTYRDRTED